MCFRTGPPPQGHRTKNTQFFLAFGMVFQKRSRFLESSTRCALVFRPRLAVVILRSRFLESSTRCALTRAASTASDSVSVSFFGILDPLRPTHTSTTGGRRVMIGLVFWNPRPVAPKPRYTVWHPTSVGLVFWNPRPVAPSWMPFPSSRTVLRSRFLESSTGRAIGADSPTLLKDPRALAIVKRLEILREQERLIVRLMEIRRELGGRWGAVKN